MKSRNDEKKEIERQRRKRHITRERIDKKKEIKMCARVCVCVRERERRETNLEKKVESKGDIYRETER